LATSPPSELGNAAGESAAVPLPRARPKPVPARPQVAAAKSEGIKTENVKPQTAKPQKK
jgi:hypothetical protein